ncbi:MAG: HNH endonuclease [Candidatus Nanopelagicaceae bacterium]|nr:HNH endonuclease [Candidatus Nanopelagicaceae bacterium]
MRLMDPFWIVVLAIFVLYRIYKWDESNKIRNEYERVRKLKKSYSDTARDENPELVDKYWNPNRNPVPAEIRPKIFARTKGHCYYCDKDLSQSYEWQVDHIWPYRYGGSEEIINLVPSCRRCNEAKWSHLPPRYLLNKWVVGAPFTQHELKFIDFHRTHSMADLIGTSAHWKGIANYWLDHVYKDFADLITLNESVVSASGKRREELVAKGQDIYKKLDCDIATRSSSFRVIEKWIEDKEFFDKYLQENPEGTNRE